MSRAQTPRITRSRLIGGAVVVVLAAAMLLNTRFLTPEEVDALTPDEFDPAATAEDLHAQAAEELVGDPADLDAVTSAIAEDPEAAAEEFEALSPSEGTDAYTVSVTGTVEDADENTLTLGVDGLSTERPVVVPVGTAVDGTLIRDLTGFEFGDAPGQTGYQQVGNELAALLRADAAEALGDDPSSLVDQEVTVRGVLRHVRTGGETPEGKPITIQPIELEADG